MTVTTTSEFPFSTKEPEIYQASFVVESGAFGDKWFVARKKEKWRIDFFENGGLSRTQLSSDALYLVDHKRKIFTTNTTTDDMLSGLTDKFFKGKEYREFEKLGGAGGLTKYRVAGSDGKGDVLISVDEKSGLMMRQEFSGSGAGSIPFVYEVRDLKFEVDDEVFQVPADLRKVSWDEYRMQAKHIK